MALRRRNSLDVIVEESTGNLSVDFGGGGHSGSWSRRRSVGVLSSASQMQHCTKQDGGKSPCGLRRRSSVVSIIQDSKQRMGFVVWIARSRYILLIYKACITTP